MSGGLLGSFDSSMENVDLDLAATLSPSTGRRNGGLDGVDEDDSASPDAGDGSDRVDRPALTSRQQRATTADLWRSTGTVSSQPAREIDERARQTAARLVGRRSASIVVAHLVETESGRRQRVDGPVVIGRGEQDPDGAVRFHVTHALASRDHCRILPVGDGHVVVDTGSANGTFVVRGGDVVLVEGEPVMLRSDDVIATAGGHRHLARFESETVTS